MNATYRNILFGLIALPTASAVAEPFGYSVNSDEPGGDSLYRIDLENGDETELGLVQSLGVTRTDIEGLAIDPGGVLWAVDDESLQLFPVDTSNGQVDFQDEVPLTGLGAVSGNDFGMTFTCSGELFLATVSDQSLYRVSMSGAATLVGNLGVRISAIAARGNPARLYGLGNGLQGDGGPADNRSLYEIDPLTGATTLIGAIGAQADDYYEAGLSFDDTGDLWAITDRRTPSASLGSQVLRLNIATGAATLVSTTTVTGFESLAVAAPGECGTVNPPPPTGPRFPEYEGIPTLDAWGRTLAVLTLALFGFAALRHRP